MTSKKLLESTSNGVEVYVGERTMKHMEAHINVEMAHIIEAIKRLDYKEPFFIGTVDLGRPVGKDCCVLITQQNKKSVRYLYRKNRQGKTPVILGGCGVDTNLLTIGICRDKLDGLNTVFTAFYGKLAAKEPWDASIKTSDEKEVSENFWKSHAIIVSDSEIDWERSDE